MDEDFKGKMREMFSESIGYQLSMWYEIISFENDAPIQSSAKAEYWKDPLAKLPEYFWSELHVNLRVGILGTLRLLFASNFTEDLLEPILKKSEDQIRLQFFDEDAMASHQWKGFAIRSPNLSMNILSCEDEVAFTPLILTETIATSLLKSGASSDHLTLFAEYYIATDLISLFETTPALLAYLWVSETFNKSDSILLQPTITIPDYGLAAVQLTEEAQSMFLEMLTGVLGAKINPSRFPETSAKLAEYDPATTRIFFRGNLEDGNWSYFLYNDNFQAEVMCTVISSTQSEICMILRRDGKDFGEHFPILIFE